MTSDGGAGHILFSGCAASRAGKPTQRATIALARALHIDLWAAPETGCCGARVDRRVSPGERRRALEPLYEGAHSGLDIVCLSPACRRVVAEAAPAVQRDAVRVREVVGLLHDVYGLANLAARATVGLGGLRVALHATCHGGHDAAATGPQGPGGVTGVGAALVGRLLGVSRGAEAPLNEPQTVPLLHDVVAVSGADLASDVSEPGRCAEHPLLGGLRGRFMGGARSAPCLALAARARADVLVTPCFLCFIALNRYQRGLAAGDPGRDVPVLHVSQLIGVACEVAPGRLDLTRTTVSARRALQPFVV